MEQPLNYTQILYWLIILCKFIIYFSFFAVKILFIFIKSINMVSLLEIQNGDCKLNGRMVKSFLITRINLILNEKLFIKYWCILDHHKTFVDHFRDKYSKCYRYIRITIRYSLQMSSHIKCLFMKQAYIHLWSLKWN